MKLQWHNPKNVPVSKLPEGYRFALVEEVGMDSPLRGKCYPFRWHNNFEVDGFWACDEGHYTYCTAEPLPMSYLIGDAAEEFDDPAYRRSVKHYFEQGWEVETRFYKGNWYTTTGPVWRWSDYFYRLTGNKRKDDNEPKSHILDCLELAGKQWKLAEDILAEQAPANVAPIAYAPLTPEDFLTNGPWWVRNKKNKSNCLKLVVLVDEDYIKVVGDYYLSYDDLKRYYERSNDGINWYPCHVEELDNYELSY